MRALCLSLTVLLVGCVHHPAPPAPPEARDAPPEGTLPSLFTAEQLREAFPTGSTVKLSIQAEGAPTLIERWTFTACTAEGATIHTEIHDEADRWIEDGGSGTATWAELREHAAFPADATTRAETTFDGPMGHFDAWLITVTRAGDDGTPEINRYYFARTLPGPPLLFTTERAGREVFRMTQLERTPRPP